MTFETFIGTLIAFSMGLLLGKFDGYLICVKKHGTSKPKEPKDG